MREVMFKFHFNEKFNCLASIFQCYQQTKRFDFYRNCVTISCLTCFLKNYSPQFWEATLEDPCSTFNLQVSRPPMFDMTIYIYVRIHCNRAYNGTI